MQTIPFRMDAHPAFVRQDKIENLEDAITETPQHVQPLQYDPLLHFLSIVLWFARKPTLMITPPRCFPPVKLSLSV
jgi:hypothetical protein